MREDEMVGWHHQLTRHEFEHALGDEGQGSLECCSPWGRKELDMTYQLNNNNLGELTTASTITKNITTIFPMLMMCQDHTRCYTSK